MLLLKRNHVTLDRDVIVVTEAGEEGSSEFGVECSVKEHWPDIEAEYALAEGGSVSARHELTRFVQISTPKKRRAPRA
jgi:hypothetical protein